MAFSTPARTVASSRAVRSVSQAMLTMYSAMVETSPVSPSLTSIGFVTDDFYEFAMKEELRKAISLQDNSNKMMRNYARISIFR